MSSFFIILTLYSNDLLFFSDLASLTPYYVRAGSNKMDKGGSVHRVTNLHIYNNTNSSWVWKVLHHDIALFQVKPPFHFSRTVRPVRLPRSTHEISHELLVCGWGYTSNGKVSKLNL